MWKANEITRKYWWKSGHFSGHLTKIFHFLKKLNHFTKSNKKSDYAKVLLLRVHFNLITHHPLQFKPHVPVFNFRSEKVNLESRNIQWYFILQAIFATMNSPRFISNLTTNFNEFTGYWQLRPFLKLYNLYWQWSFWWSLKKAFPSK